MRFLRTLSWLLIAISLSGCQSGPDLVVWADSWLENIALGMISHYQEAHPDHEIELVLRSSEVIAQNLKYGQPIDIVLSMDQNFKASTGVRGRIAEFLPFASDRVVLVECTEQAKTKSFDTQGCLVIAASDRPLRNYIESWDGHPADSCKIIADFPAQVRDYLARGWVKGGYIFESAARNLGAKIEIVGKGPWLDGCVSGIRLNSAPNPENAKLFMENCRSEKTKSLLVQNHFIPYF